MMKKIPQYPEIDRSDRKMVDAIARETKISKPVIKKVLYAFTREMAATLMRRDKFNWSYIGVLSLTFRRAHPRFDIETFNKTAGKVKQMRTIPMSPVINFCISRTFANFLIYFWGP
jgi:nucleoid DNA-binding protein